MVAALLAVSCLLVAAAAFLPLRRPVFVGMALLVMLGFVTDRAVHGGRGAAAAPLSNACVFLVVLLIRYLVEQRRAAYGLLVAERSIAVAQATAAAEGERVRIARDLHDGLTHQLSALLLQVQTAQALLADGDVPMAADRMHASVSHARQCLNEARDVVDVLRAGRADLGALVGVADDWANATGREISVTLPPQPVHLDGAHWGAVMAVLRESLTNTARHGTSRQVTVELRASIDEMVLTVCDAEPDPAVPCTPDRGGGFGLIGLGERAALLNGTVAAGPHNDGWRTVLRLPSNNGSPGSVGPLAAVGGSVR